MGDEKYSPMLRLLIACTEGDVETMKVLLEKGVDVNAREGVELASSPGPKRGPGTHYLRMRQSVPEIPVHRIFP